MSKTPAEPSTGEREAFAAHLLKATWHKVLVNAKDEDDDGASIYRMCRIAAIEAWTAAIAAQAPSPVAPREPTYYVSGPYFDGSMSVCELATGKILHKFRLDGAAIPDEKAEHWCALEHGGVFCRHCDAAAMQPRQAPSDALTDEEIVGRAKARGIHDGEAAISLVRAIHSTQGDRNG